MNAGAGVAVRAAAVGAAACCSVWLWTLRYTPESALLHDASAYFAAATAILAGAEAPVHEPAGEGTHLDVAYPTLLALSFRALGVSVAAGQALNAVLWGLTCALVFLVSRRWLRDRAATALGCVVAFSPMLSSFAPKLYSEHTAILGLTLALWAWLAHDDAGGTAGRRLTAVALAGGAALLALTKSAFFPLLPCLAVVAALRRRALAALALLAALLAVLPVHLAVERGGRGRKAAAHQIARLERWPTQVVLGCGAYALSRNLGKALVPGVEGACEPFTPTADMPMAELNAARLRDEMVARGFTYGDAARAVARKPLKYLLVCGTNLLGAVWIEGVYPTAARGLGGAVRLALWLGKVVLSSALWLLAVRAAVAAWREPRRRAAAVPLLVPIAYVIAVQANVLGEQRYFFPLLPLLYMLASQGPIPAVPHATSQDAGASQPRPGWVLTPRNTVTHRAR